MPRVLLIGGDAAGARFVQKALAGCRHGSCRVDWEPRLAEGVARLASGQQYAAVLIDAGSPEGGGAAGVAQVCVAALHVPVLTVGPPDGNHDGVARPVPTRNCSELGAAWPDGPALRRAVARGIARRAADEALFLQQAQADVTLNSLGDAVLSADLEGRVTYLNPIAERMTGWQRQDAIGQPVREVLRFVDATTRVAARDPMAEALALDCVVGLTPNCVLIRRDGVEAAIEDSAAPVRSYGGQVMGTVIVFRDVTCARALAERTAHLAQHDSLTDLPNRLLLDERLTQAAALACRRGHRLAVLFLDLDRFKDVNDHLGHAAGDALLRSVGLRLAGCVRSSDTVSRQGGDEFVVLLPEIDDVDDAAASARKILAALVPPIEVDGHRLHVTATIGISVCPDDGVDAQRLITCADVAMYHGKGDGRNTYGFFDRDRDTRIPGRVPGEHSLYGAW